MKNWLIYSCLLSFYFLASCKKDKIVLSKATLQYKIDSIYSKRLDEIESEARRDLEHRITIEVKVKADSIYKIKAKIDTAGHLPKPSKK